ncbi:MAG: hypothetical protein MZV70_60670 [Desulfobacterales bacterium]|nr:hypothetical protein [Desulfobacterales bacterium]
MINDWSIDGPHPLDGLPRRDRPRQPGDRLHRHGLALQDRRPDHQLHPRPALDPRRPAGRDPDASRRATWRTREVIPLSPSAVGTSILDMMERTLMLPLEHHPAVGPRAWTSSETSRRPSPELTSPRPA